MAGSVNASLPAELALQDVQIAGLAGLTRLVNPPWTLKLIDAGPEVAVGIALGYGLGVATGG